MLLKGPELKQRAARLMLIFMKMKLNIYYCKVTKINHFTHYQQHFQPTFITKRDQNMQKNPITAIVTQ
jgi:hypothetical protein